MRVGPTDDAVDLDVPLLGLRLLAVLEVHEVPLAVEVVPARLVAGHLEVGEVDVVHLARRRDSEQRQRFRMSYSCGLKRSTTRRTRCGRTSVHPSTTSAARCRAGSAGA